MIVKQVIIKSKKKLRSLFLYNFADINILIHILTDY